MTELPPIIERLDALKPCQDWQTSHARTLVLRLQAERDINAGLYRSAQAIASKLEGERDALLEALKRVHDLSLLPFDDNKRREISTVAREAIANVEGKE